MTGAGDATGLLGTAVGLGATLLFTGMLIKQTQHMTDKLIDDGKKQGKKTTQKRKSSSKKGSKKKTTKNINKRVRY